MWAGPLPEGETQNVHRPGCAQEACAREERKEGQCGWSIMTEGEDGLTTGQKSLLSTALNFFLTAGEGHWKAFTPSCNRDQFK